MKTRVKQLKLQVKRSENALTFSFIEVSYLPLLIFSIDASTEDTDHSVVVYIFFLVLILD